MDRDKVIKDLEEYRDREFVKEGITVFDNDPRYRKLIIGNALALLKDDETWIQYLNDHIAMCKEEVERLYKEQENASKRNPVIVCPHCGKRVK